MSRIITKPLDGRDTRRYNKVMVVAYRDGEQRRLRVEKPAIRVWLKEYRGNRTHQEVAVLAGVSRNYYTEIENGVKNPSVETAKKLAEALELDWTLFFSANSREKQQIVI